MAGSLALPLPHLVFIRCLKDFLAGQDVRPQLAAITGLSPPAQMLREKILSWSPASLPDRKISRLLAALIQQPDKVTAKTFNDLAALVQPNPLAAELFSLGQAINQLRKINRKRGGIHLPLTFGRSLLERADNLLTLSARTWSPEIRSALFHPFSWQLWQCCQRLWELEDFDSLLYLLSSLPVLSSWTFGPDATSLLECCLKHVDGCASEREYLAVLDKSRPQGLESQAQALGQIRKVLHTGTFEPSPRFLDKFSASYINLLNEIGRLQADLKPREKIDLQRVMDPIFFADLDWLEDEGYSLEELLHLAFASGIAGVKLSLLSLLTRDFEVSPALKEKAKAVLTQFPYPGDQQLTEILMDPDLLPFPDVYRVQPLFQLYPDQPSLRQLFFKQVNHKLGLLLVASAFSLHLEKGQKVKQEKMRNCQGGMRTLNSSLAQLAEYPESEPLRESAACFPAGYLTPDGYQLLLQRLYARTGRLDQLLSQLDESIPFASLPDLFDSPFAFLFSSDWLEEYDNLLLQFLIGHLNDLDTASLENIRYLVDKFGQAHCLDPKLTNFFLHLATILQRRLQAGETEAEELYDRIMAAIISVRNTGPSRPRRTRR